ncbi:hypothetical protein [Flexivirga oryzae]|uniref:Uncharacterized protein n=1 Tax=Flexivirga oryzae TaxID=1794944 RepID=A0A839NBK3_9MICO|nr:hypothetical protein [Flexivirga oryzae]MBB2892101.1 hypothetical protein [Flexivirga oryzae]
MTEITQPAVNYPDVLHMPPRDALQLGVEGQDREANQTRLVIAERIVGEADAATDRAYASAHWMNEPDVPQPRIAQALAAHGGDMAQAVRDPRVVEGVRDQLGYRPQWEDVYDYEDDMIPSGQHLFNQLEADDRALGEVRTTINEMRAAVGVEPIDEQHLLAATGVEPRSGLEVAEARAVSHGKGAAAERLNIVTADLTLARQPGDAPSF